MSPTRQLFQQGRWDSALIQSALSHTQVNGTPSDWINFLDICHAMRGLSLAEWQMAAHHYNTLSSPSRKFLLRLIYLILTPNLIPDLTSSQRHSYYASLQRMSWTQAVASTSDTIRSGYLGTRLGHYPSLLSLPPESQSIQILPLDYTFRRRRRQACELKQLMMPFDKLIKHSLTKSTQSRSQALTASIAVVGNSPSILDTCHGAEIDTADVVIRFNHVSIDQSKVQHTGSTTDIWVMSPETPIKYCPHDAHSIIVSGVHSLTRASFYWQNLPKLNKTASEFPSAIWHELVSQFQAPPSAGVLLLASLNALRVDQDLDIRCYGFTKNHMTHSQQANHHADNALRSTRHNWTAEANWLSERFP